MANTATPNKVATDNNATDIKTSPEKSPTDMKSVDAASADAQTDNSPGVKAGKDPKQKAANFEGQTKQETGSEEQSEKNSDNQNSDNNKQVVNEKEESVGKGPKPVGPNQQTWDNPEASDEVKKKIEEQKAKLEKLHNNPNAQDPTLQELNKKQDIESRNEDPEHDKKLENNTQKNFDPSKHKVDAPAH